MVRKPQGLFPTWPPSAPPFPLSCRKDKLLRFSPSLEGEWPSDTGVGVGVRWDRSCAGEAWGARGAGLGGPGVGLAEEGLESRWKGGKVGNTWALEGPSLGKGVG